MAGNRKPSKKLSEMRLQIGDPVPLAEDPTEELDAEAQAMFAAILEYAARTGFPIPLSSADLVTRLVLNRQEWAQVKKDIANVSDAKGRLALRRQLFQWRRSFARRKTICCYRRRRRIARIWARPGPS